ncbi:MAG: DUF6115 domain-containing protein [Mobilitalea sp.]
MNPLEIALIIIGIIIIAISCKLVDRAGKANSQPTSRPLSLEHSITEEDKKQLKDKMNELLSEVSEEAIIRTDDTLSKLSNEKIMAVNDFSEQVLEKVKRNHEEVVFLYNMLNDKEKELKAAVREIDSSKKKVQDIQAAKNVKTQAPAKAVTQAAQIEKPIKSENRAAESTQEFPTLNSMSSNYNTQILTLYSQGRTVMEISKLLGLGQGEVKLVIDLFKGKK